MILKLIRWLLVPVSTVAIAAGAVALSRALVGWFDQRCAPENLIGGACVESWHTGAVETGIYAAVILGGFLLATIPALLAPAYRRAVAVLILLLVFAGIAWANFTFGWGDIVLPSIVALAVTALGCLLIWRRQRAV